MQVSSGACVKKDKVISSNNVGGVCANPAVSFINVDSCFMTTVANACSTMFYKGADGDAVVVCGSPGEIANDAVGNNMFQFASSTYCVLCLLVLFVTVVLNVLAALCSQHSFK